MIDQSALVAALSNTPQKDGTRQAAKLITDAITVAGLKPVFLTAGSSYTRPADCKHLIVFCVAAGGAGGGAPTCSSQLAIGGGGGAGALSVVYIEAPDASYSYSIGSGGTGVSGADGNDGGDTTFGSVCGAKGGHGGTALAAGTGTGAALPGTGGSSSSGVGDLTVDGGQGNQGMRLSATQGWSGSGAASRFGSGGRSVIAQAGGLAGAGAAPYGAGGGGAATTSTAAAGGSGKQGCIEVWEIY